VIGVNKENRGRHGNIGKNINIDIIDSGIDYTKSGFKLDQTAIGDKRTSQGTSSKAMITLYNNTSKIDYGPALMLQVIKDNFVDILSGQEKEVGIATIPYIFHTSKEINLLWIHYIRSRSKTV
jgi:hypothetical protein